MFTKFLCIAVMTLGILIFAGCDVETEPGGPGTQGRSPTTPGDDDMVTNADNTFRLTVPSGEVEVDAGGSQAIKVGIERGSEFKQTVKVTVMAPADKITVSPKEITFRGDQVEAELTLTAVAAAIPGETNITLIGKPETGRQVEQGITVHVHEKE